MICLVDGNNFFASCERIFNPKLNNKPILVLSNGDGCVIARSNEAKLLGIRMAQPVFELKDIIEKNDVHVFSANFILYGDMSNRMINILQEYSPNVEVYSIDEAFFDLILPDNTLKTLTELGWEIKNRIKKCTGIPIGVGISYTKVLAKIANRIAKKSSKAQGVLALVENSHIDHALNITEVGDIWGIGRRYAAFLKKNGIHTAKDFRDADENWVKKNLTIVGSKIQKELKKESCIDLETTLNSKKSIVVSRSFSKYLTTYNDLISPFTYFVTSGCSKLRKQKSETYQIGIYLRTNPFSKNKPQYSAFKTISLPFYTSCDFHILKALLHELKSIYKDGYEYKKCGVYFFGLSPESHLPSNLFDSRNISKERKIFEQFDKIKDKFGLSSIYLASSMDYKWKPQLLLRSPEYTTNMKQIINI